MDAQERSAYENALARLLEGEPEPDDGELIARTVRDHPDLRHGLSGALVIDELLRQHAEPNPAAFSAAFVTQVQAASSGGRFVERIATVINERPARGTSSWLPWSLALAAGLLAVISWWNTLSTRPDPTPPKATGDERSLALMVNEAGARFADGAGPAAVSFVPGDYALTHGVAHVRFLNGTDVVLVAPADFTITDALHMRMTRGSMRALVPPSGYGFVVDTPQARYRDLGTEFGVTAGDAGERSDLHVFAGQVEVYPPGTSTPSATLTGGESLRHRHGLTERLPAADERHYPTPQSISLMRWERQREDLQNDPDLVFYHSFVPLADRPEILRDTARHGMGVDGTISGARWVTGRWPGKQALQFEQAGDRVALTIPEEFTQVTLAAWIKIDRLDHAANGLLMSVGWRPGNLQWQLDRRGSPAPTAIYSSPKRQVIWSKASLPIGRWAHCAMTVDRSTSDPTIGRVLNYVNGELAGESRINIAGGTIRIRPGACMIGTWIADNKAQEDRDFRGRMDELAMWRVALPAERIAQLATEGTPIDLSPGSPSTTAGPSSPKPGQEAR